MPEVTLVGMDLAKRLLQLHGARCDGTVRFVKSVDGGSCSRSCHSCPNA